jgi:hypothetical protein
MERDLKRLLHELDVAWPPVETFDELARLIAFLDGYALATGRARRDSALAYEALHVAQLLKREVFDAEIRRANEIQAKCT